MSKAKRTDGQMGCEYCAQVDEVSSKIIERLGIVTILIGFMCLIIGFVAGRNV